MTRMFRGNRPEVSTIIGTHPAGWELHVYKISKDKHGNTWANCKLVYPGEFPQKANYWIGYNLTKSEFNSGAEFKKLFEVAPIYHPPLDVWTEQRLLEWNKVKDKGKLFRYWMK